MAKAGLAGVGDAGSEDMQVACLEAWARTTEQDLVLAQALLAHPLGPSDDLSTSLHSVLGRDRSGHTYLTRQVPHSCSSFVHASQRSCCVFGIHYLVVWVKKGRLAHLLAQVPGH